MRRPSKFTEADVRRVIRAVRKEGVPARVDIVVQDGRISITPIPGADNTAPAVATDANEWDAIT
jgi:hypothetical protein